MDLNTFKSGQEAYFIDKSEGPGVVIYVQGTIVGVGKADATLEVTDSGTLIAPGYIVPYDPEYTKGSVIRITDDADFDILSPDEFSRLREEYEVVPKGTVIDDPEPPAIAEEVPEDENGEKEVTRDEVEEGAPVVGDEEDGLYLTASLKSWKGIAWPKGFPQDWMDQVYKDLPTGAAWDVGGEPAVGIPGGKGPGIPPDAKADLEKEFNDASKRAQEAAKKMDNSEVELSTARQSGNIAAIAEKEKAKKEAAKAFEDAKREFFEVKKKIGGEEGKWVRPPDEATYERIPGRHAPRDISFGKMGLRQAVKQLSDNYKKTLDLVENVGEAELRADQYQRELDLILRLRKKQLVDKSENPNDPYFTIEEGEKGTRDPSRILNLLKKLKEKELKKKPYLFSLERTKDKSGHISPSERDRVLGTSTTAEVFEDKIGAEPTFFDLPPEEVDMLIKREVEKNGPMDSKEVAARAQEYAKEYKDFLQRYTEWKDISEEIQKYLRAKHSLAVSDEQSDRLEKEIYQKSARTIVVKGRDTHSGELKEMALAVQDIFDEVVHPIVKNYNSRVKYLQFLQNGRKNALAKQKGELRRMLVEKKEEEVKPIDESKYKDAIISLFRRYAKYSHESDTAEKIPSRFRVHHGLPSLEEKNKELKDLEVEELELNVQRKKLEETLHKTYAPYEKAADDLELFKMDMHYLKETEVVDSGVLGTIEDLEGIVTRIRKLISQREFVGKFPTEGNIGQIGEISAGTRAAITELDMYRPSLTSQFPKKHYSKLLAVLADLRKSSNAYETTAKSIEEKRAQINLKLEKIREKRDHITEEIK